MASKKPQNDVRRFIGFIYQDDDFTHHELCAAKTEANCSMSVMGVLKMDHSEGFIKNKGYVLDTRTGLATSYELIRGNFHVSQFVRSSQATIC